MRNSLHEIMATLMRVTNRYNDQDLTFFVSHDVMNLEIVIASVRRVRRNPETGELYHRPEVFRSTYRVAEESIVNARYSTVQEMVEGIVHSIYRDMMGNAHKDGERVAIPKVMNVSLLSNRVVRAIRKEVANTLGVKTGEGKENTRARALKGYLSRRRDP